MPLKKFLKLFQLSRHDRRRRRHRRRDGALLVEAAGLDDDLGDQVGVAVGGRPSVLEVSGLVLGDLSRDSDGAASVGDAGGEVVDG